jgi:phage repressor protein C with HTH and peptisase S24 domain
LDCKFLLCCQIGMDPVRKRLVKAIEAKGLNLKDVSLRIGRSHSYIQQFLHRGVPVQLPEKVRVRLADLLELSEEELGKPEQSLPIRLVKSEVINVPEFAVQTSAGGGAIVMTENKRRDWPFPPDYLRDELGLGTASLALLEVRGDSMEPTLHSGDRVMINMSDCQIQQPGVFVLHDGDGTVIKRVEKVPFSEPPMVLIRSDNPTYGQYQVQGELIRVFGRVVWAAKRL